MARSPGRLLVNFWYAHNVGHGIEALRYCLGYHLADPSLRIELLLSRSTPVELAGCCPFVSAVHTVNLRFPDAGDDPEAALARISLPRQWDWVVDDARRSMPQQVAAFPGLAAYYGASDRWFRARRGRGLAGAAPPPYVPGGRLALELPAGSRDRAARLPPSGAAARRVRIAVMPAGGGERWTYPSVTSWLRVLGALTARFPGAAICLVGKLARDERTSTTFHPDELAWLLRHCPGTVDCFDLSLVDQLAVVEACDVFVAPHTGFGMAALAVGSPWLALSGNRWPEYLFNGVPFYSVLPDPGRFPCYTGLGPEPPSVAQDTDGEGRRSLSMCAARVEADLDELVAAAGALVERRLPYDEAMRGHFDRLLRFHGGDRSRIWSIDHAHAAYV